MILLSVKKIVKPKIKYSLAKCNLMWYNKTVRYSGDCELMLEESPSIIEQDAS